MLTVTPAARARLLCKLDRRKAAGDVALRFTRDDKGWRLRLTRERPGDTAFTFEGKKVLLLGAAVAKGMSALTLDAVTTDAGVRLKLT